jgi:hypothetical protein
MSTRLYKIRISLLTAFLLALSLTANAQQTSGDVAIGFGVAYGFDIVTDGELGVDLNAYYSITDGIRLGVDFIYYLLNDPQFQEPRFFEVNVNSSYHFVNREVLRMYVLLGMHYASFRYDRPVISPDSEESDSEIGFNMGWGIEFDYKTIILFIEPKLTIGGFDQPSITVGGRLPF